MKAVFLDRDGIINEDFGYVGKIEDFKFRDGIFEVLRNLEEKGYLLFIVTNQSGIGREYYTEEDFFDVMKYAKSELKKENINLKDFAYCPHTPNDSCDCRKPNPGMILDLANKYNINLKESWMVGDKQSDVEAGKNAGVNTLLIRENIFDIIEKIN
jgi:D-glycero-D-manno-heptose 1,7-bisphosphate phosphatase